jgi:carbonic anhydrase/acetyltransferase-like protein (isoleucine patch superfamily)
MYLPPLQMPVSLDRVIIGDVQIDPNAAIAPGVILQADPGSSIVIGTGVGIGMGAIIHARNGNILIEAGTSLGAGVLIVGKAEIGINCCIGSCVTLVNCSLESGSIVAAGLALENGLIQNLADSQTPKVKPEVLGLENFENILGNSGQNTDKNTQQNTQQNSEQSIANQNPLTTAVSASSAIALNHAKAHLSKFSSKIQLS